MQLTTDSQTRANLPILYSLRHCPYAMRARIAIFKSKKPVYLRDLKLNNKPAEMLASQKAGPAQRICRPGTCHLAEFADRSRRNTGARRVQTRWTTVTAIRGLQQPCQRRRGFVWLAAWLNHAETPPAMLSLERWRAPVTGAGEAPSARNRWSGGRAVRRRHTFSFGSRMRSTVRALVKQCCHRLCRGSTEPSRCQTTLCPACRPARRRALVWTASMRRGPQAAQNSTANHCRPRTHPPTNLESGAAGIDRQQTRRHAPQQVSRFCPTGPASCRPGGRRRPQGTLLRHLPACDMTVAA